MLKRIFDIILSIVLLLLLLLPAALIAFLVWRGDGHSPFYAAPRVGKDGKLFTMFKFRSMRVGADRSGVDSTAADDGRITAVGHFIRRYKLDEIPQLYNVLRGDMSFVGPRPNVERAVAGYTSEERKLLRVAPGITDIASIVFADEGQILRGSKDPDRDYDLLIRPGKSRLGIFYVENASVCRDLALLGLTAWALVNRRTCLQRLSQLLQRWGAGESLVNLARRDQELSPGVPPGVSEAK